MAKNDDLALKATFFGCAGAAAILAAVNWGYHYEHEFNATIDGYEGETHCVAADDCTTRLTHMRVTNEDIGKRAWLELDRPILLDEETVLPFAEDAQGTVTATISPNTRGQMYTSRHLVLDGTTFTPQM